MWWKFVILLPKTNLKYSFEIAERQNIEAHTFTYESKTNFDEHSCAELKLKPRKWKKSSYFTENSFTISLGKNT